MAGEIEAGAIINTDTAGEKTEEETGRDGAEEGDDEGEDGYDKPDGGGDEDLAGDESEDVPDDNAEKEGYERVRGVDVS